MSLIDSGNLAAARELLGNSIEKATGLDRPDSPGAPLLVAVAAPLGRRRTREAAARYAWMALASIELTENVEYAGPRAPPPRATRARAWERRGGRSTCSSAGPRSQSRPAAQADGRFKLERARALAALGRDDEAIALATEAADELSESRPEQAGRAYAVAADVFARRGDAGGRWRCTSRRASSLGRRTRSSSARCTRKMAELLETEGRKDEALELLKRALVLQGGAPRQRLTAP